MLKMAQPAAEDINLTDLNLEADSLELQLNTLVHYLDNELKKAKEQPELSSNAQWNETISQVLEKTEETFLSFKEKRALVKEKSPKGYCRAERNKAYYQSQLQKLDEMDNEELKELLMDNLSEQIQESINATFYSLSQLQQSLSQKVASRNESIKRIEARLESARIRIESAQEQLKTATIDANAALWRLLFNQSAATYSLIISLLLLILLLLL